MKHFKRKHLFPTTVMMGPRVQYIYLFTVDWSQEGIHSQLRLGDEQNPIQILWGKYMKYNLARFPAIALPYCNADTGLSIMLSEQVSI